MGLPPEAIAHLAWLARLELRPEEASRLQHDLDGILEFVRVLQEVATDGIAGASTAEFEGRLRADEARAGVSPETALANAPERVGEFFALPPVVERR